MKSPSIPSRPGAYRLALEIPSTGAVTGVRLPHLVVVGEQKGPVTAVTAGQHGREVAGTLVSALAFDALEPSRVRGTIHFFPTVNPIALRLRQQDYPIEETRYRKISLSKESNLDRLWGGNEPLDPLLTAITSQLWDTYLVRCEYLLDLHCWSRFFCPMAWAHQRDAALLVATGFPWLTLRQDHTASLYTLREKAWSAGKPIVVAELPGQNVASPDAITLGLKTIRNFLIACGHLDESPSLPDRQVQLRDRDVRSSLDAPATGLWHPLRQVGECVERDQVLGEILDLETFKLAAEVRTEISGLLLFNGPPIWGEDHREHQVVYAGQRLSQVQPVDRLVISKRHSCPK